MSLLSQVVRGPVVQNDFIIALGPAGVGKTTFASRFPSPLFLDFENGSNHLDVPRLKPASFKEVIEVLDELIKTDHSYKSLTVDSLDQFEIIIHEEVCKENRGAKNIADIPYGAGYVQALNKWKEFVERAKLLRPKMHIILIAHSVIKTINDPSLPTQYDKHCIKLNQKAADFLKESVDAVLFANFEIFIAKKSDRDLKGKAYGEGKRILSTMATPGAEGKNRYGLPAIIDLDYDAYIQARKQCDPTDPKKISERIEHYLPQLKDEATKTKAKSAYEKAKGNIPELLKIEQRLKTIVETV